MYHNFWIFFIGSCNPNKKTRGKYKFINLDMKTMGGKLDIHIPDDILRVVGENARNLVNYCGLVVRTIAPLTTIDWKEVTDRVGEQMLLKIKVINLLLVMFISK